VKVTISPDGWAELEVDNVDDALKVIAAMRNEVAVPPVIPAGAWAGTPWTLGKAEHPEDSPTKEYAEREMKGGPGLPPTLDDVYTYLHSHPHSEGLTRTEIAEGLNLKITTTDTRLRTLQRLGHVTQPSRGKWTIA